MPKVIETDKWECPNHHRCGAVAYIDRYACGCVRVRWQQRGRYDHQRCAPNPRDVNSPNYPRCH